MDLQRQSDPMHVLHIAKVFFLIPIVIVLWFVFFHMQTAIKGNEKETMSLEQCPENGCFVETSKTMAGINGMRRLVVSCCAKQTAGKGFYS